MVDSVGIKSIYLLIRLGVIENNLALTTHRSVNSNAIVQIEQ